MSKQIKSTGRKPVVHLYNFTDGDVNLNGYVAKCNVTGESKRFYHKYLANLISEKYDNNFSHFEATYVSRSGKTLNNAVAKADAIDDRISRLYVKIRELKAQRDELQASA